MSLAVIPAGSEIESSALPDAVQVGAHGKKYRPSLPSSGRDVSGTDGNLIREDLLASLMAGTLGPVQREEAARYLAANPEAREVLRMACEALKEQRRLRVRR